MSRLLIAFVFILSIDLTQSIYCNDGSNPCHLDNPDSTHAYFLPKNGYHCFDAFNGQIICTCPDNSTTRDNPCRICDRTPNPCGTGPSVVTCTDINQGYSCLCNDGQGNLVVSTNSCDDRGVTPAPQDKCANEGVRDPTSGLCNCPSGFTGTTCEIRIDEKLCDKVECKSNGVCAVRPTRPGASTYRSECLCRTGSDGEFCERQSVLGKCSSSYCLHGALCWEQQYASSIYVSCQCRAGWTGRKCEKQYFRCKAAGYFPDELMTNQGKYFWCIAYKEDYLVKQMSCPKGLRFNATKQICLR